MDRPGATNSSAALWGNEEAHDAAADLLVRGVGGSVASAASRARPCRPCGTRGRTPGAQTHAPPSSTVIRPSFHTCGVRTSRQQMSSSSGNASLWRFVSPAGGHPSDVFGGCDRAGAQRSHFARTGPRRPCGLPRCGEVSAPAQWMGPTGRVSHGWYRLSNPVGGRGRQPLCQGSVAQSFST